MQREEKHVLVINLVELASEHGIECVSIFQDEHALITEHPLDSLQDRMRIPVVSHAMPRKYEVVTASLLCNRLRNSGLKEFGYRLDASRICDLDDVLRRIDTQCF